MSNIDRLKEDVPERLIIVSYKELEGTFKGTSFRFFLTEKKFFEGYDFLQQLENESFQETQK